MTFVELTPRHPQTRPPAPTLTFLTLPFFFKLPWPHIPDLLKLLLKLLFSELLWLLAGFTFTIKVFAFSPMMVLRKKAAVPNKAYLVPYSLRARVFVTPHTRLITRCDPPRQSMQCREIMDAPYDCTT
jgi:hypothetical protein